MSGPMDRRTFLKRATQVGVGALVVGTGAGIAAEVLLDRSRRPWEASSFPLPGRPKVAVVRTATYDADLEGIVLDGLRAVGAEVAGRTVVLKPNFVEFDPGAAINTDPRLIAATVLAMRKLGAAEVTVAEGPGHRRDTQFVVQSSGLLEVLHDVDAPFVDLNSAPLVARRLHSSFTDLKELWLPQPIVDADIVVSMPKMKTHHWAGVTLSLKNCFGCVPGRVYGWPKNVLHWAGLTEAIVDVSAAVRPHLQIVDGIVGMQGNGPIQGMPMQAGMLVFGADPVATDVTAARLMGFDPARVPSIAEAARFLGQGDPEGIDQVGEDVERSAVDFATLPQFEGMKVGATPGGGVDPGPA
jgi:uncharacterized protein (DUF362 family)